MVCLQTANQILSNKKNANSNSGDSSVGELTVINWSSVRLDLPESNKEKISIKSLTINLQT